MPSEGDLALGALSHWHSAPLRNFRRNVELVQRHGGAQSSHVAARTLDALGHALVDFEAGTISVSPPVLARLPVRGLPQAVLCGARTSRTLERVKKHVKESGHSVVVHVESQKRPFAPTRILVEAEDWQQIASLGAAMGAMTPLEPPALALLSQSGTLGAYLERLEWSTATPLNWPRREFNPETFRWVREAPDGTHKLVSFMDPHTNQPRYFLEKEGMRTPCDKGWGRYAALSATGRNVLGYDARRHLIAVPLYCPLPGVFPRVLSLCTGRAPGIAHPNGNSLPHEVFSGISTTIATMVAGSLGQVLQEVQIMESEEEEDA